MSRENERRATYNCGARLSQERSENLLCPICQETYASDGALKPKMMPKCCHSVCEGCANQLCRTGQEVQPCCPLCRTDIQVPFNGAEKLPTNVDVINSLTLIADVEKLLCRRHHGSTEDLYCLTCLTQICAICHITDHRQHDVVAIEAAFEHFRLQLAQHTQVAQTLHAHLARAGVALRTLEERTTNVRERIVLDAQSKMKRIEDDAAILLQLLDDRLNPIKRKVAGRRSSINELIHRCRTIVDDPHKMLRQFPAFRAELERLSQLAVDINVEDIECQQVDFTPFCMTDWIPLDLVNLVGYLTTSPSDDNNRRDLPTMADLKAQLHTAQQAEASLLMKIQEMEKQRRIAENDFNEKAKAFREQELEMTEQLTAAEVKIAQLEKQAVELKRQMQKQREELEIQIKMGEQRLRDLEEQLKDERRWRRGAEELSRCRRQQNEELMAKMEEDRQTAEDRREELEDRMKSVLKSPQRRTPQKVYEVLAVTPTLIVRQKFSPEQTASKLTDDNNSTNYW